MHDADSRLEDRLRAVLHDEVRDLAFTIPVERLERRLQERRRAARWRSGGLSAAAVAVVAVGVLGAVVALRPTDTAPAATPFASVAPTGSLAVPSASTVPSASPAACTPVAGLDVAPAVTLAAVDGRYTSTGVTGSRVLGASPSGAPAEPWLFVADGDPSDDLDFLLSTIGYCASRWRVSAALTQDVAGGTFTGPTSVYGSSARVSPELRFSLPNADDWTIRVEIEWWNDGPRVHDVRYYRVLADVPQPTPFPSGVTGHPDPTVPCQPEDRSARSAPAVSLSLDGALIARDERGTESWGTAVTDSAEFAPETSIPVDSGRGLVLRIHGDVCAIAWSVSYGAVPADRLGHVAIGELVSTQANPDRDPAFARENRFPLADLPAGDWWIKADFSYVNGGALMYWRITVPSTSALPRVTFTSGDASVVAANQCGQELTSPSGETGYDECGPVFTPVDLQRALTVSPGAEVRIAVDGWEVTVANGGIVASSVAVSVGERPLTFTGLPVAVADGEMTFTSPDDAGDWHVRIDVTASRSDGSTLKQGFLIRLIVAA